MSINIRKAVKDDLNQIVELSDQLEKVEQPFDSNLKEGYYRSKKGTKGLLKDIQSESRIFLVATIDNLVVGYVDGFIYNEQAGFMKKVAYLDRLSVDERYKGKGIGTKLIDAFTDKVKEKEVKFIKLNSFEGNLPAISFYKEKGFYEYSIFYMKKLD